MPGSVLPGTNISMCTYELLFGYVSMSSSTSMKVYGDTCCSFLYTPSTCMDSVDSFLSLITCYGKYNPYQVLSLPVV